MFTRRCRDEPRVIRARSTASPPYVPERRLLVFALEVAPPSISEPIKSSSCSKSRRAGLYGSEAFRGRGVLDSSVAALALLVVVGALDEKSMPGSRLTRMGLLCSAPVGAAEASSAKSKTNEGGAAIAVEGERKWASWTRTGREMDGWSRRQGRVFMYFPCLCLNIPLRVVRIRYAWSFLPRAGGGRPRRLRW